VGLLDGKRILITGVLTPRSLAFATAQLAQREGAEIILTGAGKAKRLATRSAGRLDETPEVLEFDASEPAHVDELRDAVGERWDRVDGVLHAIGFAPQSCLAGGFLDAPWEDVAVAMHISTFSFKSLAISMAPLMTDGGSVVGLDFDATVAWPVYDWMGVAKAGLESVSRYLARDLGPKNIRVNLVAAGPQRTTAATAIGGFEAFEEVWDGRAPLGWDVTDADATARACVALLSDWFPKTTGEIIHVDGGFHAMGA